MLVSSLPSLRQMHMCNRNLPSVVFASPVYVCPSGQGLAIASTTEMKGLDQQGTRLLSLHKLQKACD